MKHNYVHADGSMVSAFEGGLLVKYIEERRQKLYACFLRYEGIQVNNEKPEEPQTT